VYPHHAATMRGVVIVSGAWKLGPLRLSGVPPAGSSLLTAAASPAPHALNSAGAGMRDNRLPMILLSSH
jgi:hypothetical protein